MSSQTRAMHLLLEKGRFVLRNRDYTVYTIWPMIITQKYTRYIPLGKDTPIWFRHSKSPIPDRRLNGKFEETLELAYQLYLHDL